MRATRPGRPVFLNSLTLTYYLEKSKNYVPLHIYGKNFTGFIISYIQTYYIILFKTYSKRMPITVHINLLVQMFSFTLQIPFWSWEVGTISNKFRIRIKFTHTCMLFTQNYCQNCLFTINKRAVQNRRVNMNQMGFSKIDLLSKWHYTGRIYLKLRWL
jgi:hypothetical protein